MGCAQTGPNEAHWYSPEDYKRDFGRDGLRRACWIPASEGGVFICGPEIESCHYCGAVAEALCDYPIGDAKTCDLPICDRHRTSHDVEAADPVDWCPQHVLIDRAAS